MEKYTKTSKRLKCAKKKKPNEFLINIQNEKENIRMKFELEHRKCLLIKCTWPT